MASSSWATRLLAFAFLSAATCASVLPAFAIDERAEQLHRLNQKCKDEKVSNFRHRNGTPSCDELDKVLRPSDIYDERTRQQQREQFRWNDGERKR